VNRIVTVGLLPASIRSQYGFAWRARDEAWFGHALRVLRATRRLTPGALAYWPDARRRQG
jgi:uncharacterized protein (DUF2236 family)